MSQTFHTTDVLRLEVETDPEGLSNLVPNPNGELGGWGWVTPISGATLTGADDDLTYTVAANVPNHFYTEPMPIAATQYAAASWVGDAPGGRHYRAKFEWLDVNKALLSSSSQTVDLPSSTATQYYGPHQAPTSTAYVRLRFDVYSGATGTGNPGSGVTLVLNRVTVAKAATAGELGTVRNNLMPNPSFETNLDGWFSDAHTIARSNAVAAMSGTYSLRLTCASAATTMDAQTLTGKRGILVGGGATFTFSFHSRAATTARTVLCVMRWYDVDGVSAGVTTTAAVANTTSWTRHFWTATAPSNARYVSITARVKAATGTIPAGEVHYFDAFQMEAGSTATAYFDGDTPDVSGATYSWLNRAPVVSGTRTNLLKNPSMETNATFWGDLAGEVSRSTVVAHTGTGSLRIINPAGEPVQTVTMMYTHNGDGTITFPVTAGKAYTFSVNARAGTIARPFTLQVRYETSAQVDVGNITSSQTFDSASSWVSKTHTTTAPAGAVNAAFYVNFLNVPANEVHYIDAVMVEQSSTAGPYFDGATADSTADFTVSDRAWTGTAHASTSTETQTVTLPYSQMVTSQLEYIEPVTYLNILGDSHEIAVTREELNVGTLSAQVLSASLDPSQETLLRPGRRCRLTVLDAEGNWSPIYTGELSNARVTYELKNPLIPDEKRARIELTAIDNITALAQTARPSGVASIDDLPFVLEGAGVPWNVNGSGDQVPSASVVSVNNSATALDQVAITRDTALAYAWVDQNNVLQVWGSAQVPANPFTWDEDDYSDLSIDYDTDRCINSVSLRYLRHADGNTSEVKYGPYEDAASVAQWGRHSAEFTIHGIVESTANMQAYATSVLTANATPQVRINRVTLPIRSTAELGKTLVDLYSLATLTNTAAGLTAVQMRATGIKHEITPDKWLVTVEFATAGGVAQPQVTPPVTREAPYGGPVRIGDIVMSGRADESFGFLKANGQSLATADYPALFAVYGYTHGGSGANFNVPNITDRFPIGVSGTKTLGSSGGAATKSVTHTLGTADAALGLSTNTTTGGTASRLTGDGDGLHNHNVTGGINDVDVMPPWRALHFYVKAR